MKINVHPYKEFSKLNRDITEADVKAMVAEHTPVLKLQCMKIDQVSDQCCSINTDVAAIFDTPVMHIELKVQVSQTEVDPEVLLNITPNVHFATIREEIVNSIKRMD